MDCKHVIYQCRSYFQGFYFCMIFAKLKNKKSLHKYIQILHECCIDIHKLLHKICKTIIHMELCCTNVAIRHSSYGPIRCLKISFFNNIKI